MNKEIKKTDMLGDLSGGNESNWKKKIICHSTKKLRKWRRL